LKNPHVSVSLKMSSKRIEIFKNASNSLKISLKCHATLKKNLAFSKKIRGNFRIATMPSPLMPGQFFHEQFFPEQFFPDGKNCPGKNCLRKKCSEKNCPGINCLKKNCLKKKQFLGKNCLREELTRKKLLLGRINPFHCNIKIYLDCH
jgi:hypothetical protein